jgi:hypothetical protein
LNEFVLGVQHIGSSRPLRCHPALLIVPGWNQLAESAAVTLPSTVPPEHGLVFGEHLVGAPLF